MKISLNWISDFVDLSGVTPEQVSDLLSLHTAEVEGLEHYGEALADVRVGEVVECGKHPDADKLSVTRVEFGAGEAVQVVCGASNVRQGLKIAFAPVGSTLPGGLKLKKAKLRGQVSQGMICSERELELSDEHAGILELPEAAPIGETLVDYLGIRDAILELDNKSLTHRPDLWGHYGFARELAAILGRELKPLPVLAEWPAAVHEVPISLGDTDSCPLYWGLAVDLGGTPRPSAERIRNRLLAVGQRPLSDIVDLTNYVLHEIGQPTHAFDLDQLKGPAIEVRRAGAGEKFTTLDETERTLSSEDLLIADGERAVALAGVMGGADTEVGDGTQRILLESAWFAPARVRRTSQRHALRTDASARFEKTLDPAISEQALRRFAYLLAEVRPEAKLLGAPAKAGAASAPEISLTLDPARTARLLGVDLDAARIGASLESLGFGVSQSGDGFSVTVPSWRSGKDVTTSIDLVEEVGRLAGYDKVEPRALEAPIVPPWSDPGRMLARRISDRLAFAQGCYETQGYTFLESRWADLLDMPLDAFEPVHNPVQAGVDRIRRDPMPALLDQAVNNLAEREAGALFEIGKGYEPRADDLPHERRWLGVVAWAPAGDTGDGPSGLFGRVRGMVDDVLRTSGVTATCQPGVERNAAPWCHPTSSLTWYAGSRVLGYSGLVDPRLCQKLEAKRATLAALLIDMEVLLELAAESEIEFRSPRRYPAIKVDVALALPATVAYEQVEASLRKAGAKTLESLQLFDVFTGGSLEAGWRSLAFHAVLRAADRTLSDKDERKFLDRVGRAAEELGGNLRS